MIRRKGEDGLKMAISQEGGEYMRSRSMRRRTEEEEEGRNMRRRSEEEKEEGRSAEAPPAVCRVSGFSSEECSALRICREAVTVRDVDGRRQV